MPYLEYYDEFIDALQMQISAKHPLFKRDICPVAVRRDPNAVIYETNDDPRLYALVYLAPIWPIVRRKRPVDPKTEILPDLRAIQELIDHDHDRWNAQFK